MEPKLIICLVIFGLSVVSFCLDKLSMGTTAITAMLLFVLTGCLNPVKAVGFFGNTSAILVVAMAVVSAGFAKTQFVNALAKWIGKIAKGNLTRITFGYVLMACLLTQLISSPVTVFCVIAPLAGATLDNLNLSRSKVMFSIGITSIATCGTLPFAASISQVAKINTFLEAAEVSYICELTDMMVLRLPLLIACVLYAAFIAPKFAPAVPELPVVAAKKIAHKDPMPKFQEYAALVIFFGTTVALILSKTINQPAYIIAMVGALLMVLTGVLKPKEATAAMPLWLYLLIVGSMGISAALVDTGAGAMLGNVIANFGSNIHSEFLLNLMFFLIPFIVTQFMQNNATLPVFIPIVIEACKIMGANPIGPCILVYAGVLGSIMTPMATAAVSQYMGEGGYTVKTTIKMSILPSLLFTIVSAISATVFFPLF